MGGRDTLNVAVVVRVHTPVPAPLWRNWQRRRLLIARLQDHCLPTGPFAPLAQLAEAIGSNPMMCWFESNEGYQCLRQLARESHAVCKTAAMLSRCKSGLTPHGR